MIRQENEQHARILQHLADATSNGSLERALQELPAEEDQEYFDPIKKRRRMTLEIQLTTKDDFLRQHDDDPLEAQQYVLPLASARAHSSRVEALPSAFTERTLCRCAWFPRCNKRVWDCGGIRKTSCHLSEADTKHQVAKYSNDGERKHCLLTEQKGDRDKGVHRATASPG